MKLTDLRVKTKLMLGLACVAAIVLLVSVLALRSLGASNSRFANYLAGVGERERLAADVRGAATRRAIAARNLVLVTDAKDVEIEKAAVLMADADVTAAVASLKIAVGRASEVTERDHVLLAEIEHVEGLYGLVARDIVGKALGGQEDAVIKTFAPIRKSESHYQVNELMNQPILEREFADWTMGCSCPSPVEFVELAAARWRGTAQTGPGASLMRTFWACSRQQFAWTTPSSRASAARQPDDGGRRRSRD